MGFMGPNPHFYGSQKPQIEIYYKGPALFKTDPIKKWHLYIKSISKSPKNPFFVLLWALWVQNSIFMGPRNLKLSSIIQGLPYFKQIQ